MHKTLITEGKSVTLEMNDLEAQIRRLGKLKKQILSGTNPQAEADQ